MDLAPTIVTTDIDGDGLPDIAITDNNRSQLLIYRNTSSGGTVSFANPISIATSIALLGLAAGDLDGDGKPDLVAGGGFGDISVFRNLSTVGNIAFSAATSFMSGNVGMRSIAIGDMDGDNKPDVLVALGSGDKLNMDLLVFALRNTSSPGTVSLAAASTLVDIPGGYTNGIALGDLDGDTKTDIVISDSLNNLVYAFRNTSSPGSISIAAGASFSAGNSAVSIGDLDGDGKPDLAVSGASGLSLLKNQSALGTISFAARVDYLAGTRVTGNCIGDLDGDGKPDLFVADATHGTISILRNKIGEPLLSPSGANPVTGDVIKTVTVDASVQQSNGITYVQRHYDIEPVNNPATATAVVQLYFTQADFDNFNAFPGHGADLPTGPTDNAGKANLRVFQNHGFSTTNTPGSYSAGIVVIDPDDGNINWNAGTQLWEVTFAVTGFSGFFISSTATSLPLKLLSFAGTVQGNNALLKWSTTNEVNTSYFELQRSTDGSAFAPIAKINASGNNSNTLHYQYTDALGTDPVYYYRLKMVDIDGASSLSDIVKITIAGRRSPLGVYPNPARNYITVEHPSASDAQIQLADMSGKLLQQVKVTKNSLQSRLNIEGLAPGTYQIIWSDGTKTLMQSLLIL